MQAWVTKNQKKNWLTESLRSKKTVSKSKSWKGRNDEGKRENPHRGGIRKNLFKSFSEGEEAPPWKKKVGGGKLYQSDTSEQVENTKVNAEIRLRNSAKRLNTFARMSSSSKREAREEA